MCSVLPKYSRMVVSFALVLFAAAHVAPGDELYWTEWGASEQNRICRSNLDGSNLTVIATGSGGNVGSEPHYFAPVGIAVDAAAGHIFWANASGTNLTRNVTRSALDGTSRITLSTSTRPFALAIDSKHGEVYWSDTSDDKIFRANFDGTRSEAIVTSGLLYVEGLAIDSDGGKLYWTDIHEDVIKRSNLDGTSVETLVDDPHFQAPSGIALDLSRGKMYWADWATYKIQRANLDGSVVEDFVTGLSHPDALAIDPLGESLYCLDWGTHRMLKFDLPTGHMTTIMTSNGISSLSSIAYAVPEPALIGLMLSGAVCLPGHNLLRARRERG